MSDDLSSRARPEEPLLWFNGLDGRRGSYLTPPVPPRYLADLALGATVDLARARGCKAWVARGEGKARRGLKEGLDPCKLEEAGWGVIFPGSAAAEPLREALAPLLDLRRAQAGRLHERFFREFAGEDGYREGESKVAFLARHGAGPGPADPEKVPYYLLLVGDPETIPFSFQYQLDVQYAVGRLCFDEIEEYRRYAESVVAAETGGGVRSPRASFFAPANPGDPVTGSTCAHLARPVADAVRQAHPGWSVETALADEATRGRLEACRRGAGLPLRRLPRPGLRRRDHHQRDRQGALVCQDWPGPCPGGIDSRSLFRGRGPGGGGPRARPRRLLLRLLRRRHPALGRLNRQGQAERRALSPGAFLGRSPQRLLSHPRGGALAVVGHVDRAWGFSLVWPDAGPQITTFESALRRLLDGKPVGWAMECFNQRYAGLASDLAAEVEALWGSARSFDETVLADLWTASHDARNYAIVGDPAVRIAVVPTTSQEVQREN